MIAVIRVGTLILVGWLSCAVAHAAVPSSLVGYRSGKCLQVNGTDSATAIVQSACTGTQNQAWEITTINLSGQHRIMHKEASTGRTFWLALSNAQELFLVEDVRKALPDSDVWNVRDDHARDDIVYQAWSNAASPNQCLRIYGDTGSHGDLYHDGTPAIFGPCEVGNELFGELFLDPSTFASGEPVICSVFDDFYSHVVAPANATFISGRSAGGEKGKACSPGGPFGQCRKWSGLCRTAKTFQTVRFRVFDDGYTNLTAMSDAIYIPAAGNRACVPDGTAGGNCRRWFGRGVTRDGRGVVCRVFNDGYTNPTDFSDAVFIPRPIPSAGSACVPGAGCRRWFGQCQTQ